MNAAPDDQPKVIPLSHLDQLREAQAIIREEAAALSFVADQLTTDFTDAVETILRCQGCVVVTGVGKAGLIGQKIVATLASTGTRALFLHPTEAVHGDLGCVSSDDVVLALSNSGGSEEVLRLLPVLNRLNIPVLAITRDRQNDLARGADVVIEIGRHKEAGQLQLAPSVSTTAMLAVGDALALVLSRAKNFSPKDFATFHPAGALGRRLCPVREVMRQGSELRVARQTQTVRSILIDLNIPGRRTGAVIVTDDGGRLTGIFTDSDLARLFQKRQESLIDGPVADVMTREPACTRPDVLLPEAMSLMSERKISELPVIDEDGTPLGLVDITDLLDIAPAEVQKQLTDQNRATLQSRSA
ncbi:MAG: KpsF/GutQ family sugar-phosphate isomerase [Fuerstiella sp.]